MLVAVALILVAAFVGRAYAELNLRRYSDTHGATIVRYALESRLLGRELEEIAVRPAGGGRRPLLVLLHGRHDPLPLVPGWVWPQISGPESLLTDALLDAVAELGERAPVVVLLNGDAHSYYHDRRDGPWGSMLLNEAIPDARRRFDTLPGRTAIGGISMGGYGALFLAGTRPGEFCAAGGHSAALWRTGAESAPGAFDDAGDYARHDVKRLARSGAYAKMPMWLDVGSSDGFRSADLEFGELLRASSVDVRVHEWPGGHARSYWDGHMADYLRFYANALASCT